ncbi:MAG: DUF4270 domain-containing protein [Alistipes sp.]|nr:DUF4270 domain-containing protein [Alistipes sp.]
MIRCNNIRRTLRLLMSAVFALWGLAACTEVDDRLGEGFLPADQQMKIGVKLFSLAPEERAPFFETRLYRTDSIRSSNLGTGFFGSTSDETFGRRTAGFLSQYRAVAMSDTSGFGYRPIFDSIELKISVAEYDGDTLVPVRYNVYEVISNDYLSGSGDAADTVFYPFFDPKPYIAPKPVFTFTYPDGRTTGPKTMYVRMNPTEEGLALVRRLMLLDGDYRDDMTIYRRADLWCDAFKGVYIAPAEEPAGEGCMFATSLESSGMIMYARNRNRIDPTLIQDTVTVSYSFYKEDETYGNVSINTVRHDYAGSEIEAVAAGGSLADRPLTSTVYVEGMAGVVTELTLTDRLLEQIGALLDEEVTDESGLPYTSIAVNCAELEFYLEGSDYDWTKIDPAAITPLLDASYARMGLYADYRMLTGIADYAYAYEKLYSSQNFELPYGGYLNRSRGCYVMDVTGYLQSVWRQYLAQKRGESSDEEPADDAPRTICIGPEAYGLYSLLRTTAQGMEGGGNNAPVRLRLVYTMIK